MDFNEYFAGINDEGRRFDKVVRKMTENSNISSLYSAIRKGLIKLNNKKSDPSEKIHEGDKISIAKFLIESKKIEVLEKDSYNKNSIKLSDELTINNNSILNKHQNIEIIFQNEFIKIINKPYDVNVHGQNSLSQIIENQYKENKDNSLSFLPGPLHRLDKKTTGLIAFSNNLIGAKKFSDLISQKKVRKFYIGICQNHIEEKEIWNDYLEKNQNEKSNFYTMKIITENNSSQKNQSNLATTICTPLAKAKYKHMPVTFCQFEIITGKKHQIRCQSSFHNHPLLGDISYDGIKINEKQDFYLHAYKMIFPKDNLLELPDEISCPLNKNYKDFLNQLLINWDGGLII